MRLLKAMLNPARLKEVLRCRQLTPNWVALTAAYLHLRGRYPLSIKTVTGPIEFQTKYDVATFWLIHMAQTYKLQVDAKLILDVGANIGAFTLYALQNAPQARLIALEPAPDTFQRMAFTIQSHNFADRSTLLQKALGQEIGYTFINLDIDTQFRSTGGSVGAEVPVTTLAQLISDFGPIDYMKIDAEGAEYPSLLNASSEVLRKIGCISMEYHPVETYSSSRLFEHLISQGFTLVSHRDDGDGYGMAHLVRAPSRRA